MEETLSVNSVLMNISICNTSLFKIPSFHDNRSQRSDRYLMIGTKYVCVWLSLCLSNKESHLQCRRHRRCNASSIPGLARSPGGGNGSPLHILAWKILWTEEPGGLQWVGSQRAGRD